LTQLQNEIERVSKLDYSPRKAGAEPLLASILYILSRFDGATNATFSIEMRREFCMPVVVTEHKVILSQEFPEIYDEMSENA
jgi:hypothetical protein